MKDTWPQNQWVWMSGDQVYHSLEIDVQVNAIFAYFTLVAAHFGISECNCFLF